MKREIATGIQDFAEMRIHGDFYVDKTGFIREWWKGRDAVTLITRPRRFGKTLNMSTLNCFFSNKYADRGDLFEGLKVWEDQAMRAEQGKWPVIFLSFAMTKGITYASAMMHIKTQIVRLFSRYPELARSDRLDRNERIALERIEEDMSDDRAALSISLLSLLLEKHYGRKVLIFLDEYDTPLQEAYINGYWDQMVAFTKTLFNSTFKSNPSLARAIMTGITRVSKESIFSDLNNPVVVTTTTNMYETAFGFTEKEVFDALDQQGFEEKSKQDVKDWYDGFTFGRVTDIYNPWSVVNYLNTGILDTWWANTSSNGLIGTLLRTGRPEIKIRFEALLKGETITVPVDEQIVFNQLDTNPGAIWSLLLATGYLKIAPSMLLRESSAYEGTPTYYTLMLTNLEVHRMFERMVQEWFAQVGDLTVFAQAILEGDVRGMRQKLEDVMLNCMSSFDGGKLPSARLPENFYHGLVLGLLTNDSMERYQVKSNRESGYGRYDVVLEPKDPDDPAAILEFKVFDTEDDEKGLEDTAANALQQIEEKKYETDLLSRGIPPENIRKYGLAFRGRDCLIRMGRSSDLPGGTGRMF